MSSVDWAMLLKYVEALAPFFGALIGIPLAAHFAVAGFRKQKTIERRADWYERIHRDLVQLMSAHAMAAVPAESVPRDLEVRLVKSVQEAQLTFIASLNRPGFLGGLYLREDRAHIPTNPVRSGAA